jgi:hypothetical protein
MPFTLEEQSDLDFPLEDLESLLFGMALQRLERDVATPRAHSRML